VKKILASFTVCLSTFKRVLEVRKPLFFIDEYSRNALISCNFALYFLASTTNILLDQGPTLLKDEYISNV